MVISDFKEKNLFTSSNPDLSLINHLISREDEQTDQLGDLDKFLLIEYLCMEYQSINSDFIEQKTNFILNEMKSRYKVDLKLVLMKPGEAYFIDDNKKTSIEEIKIHLNKVTIDTCDYFCHEILKIKVATIEEMKKIAQFFFSKAISESCFLETYVKMILKLKKIFLCEEEKSMGFEQTCFYGTLLKLMMQRIKEEHSFNKDTVVSKANKSVGQIENEIERKELERKGVKNDTIGAVNLCMALYNNKVTGSKNISTMVDYLMNNLSSENLELLTKVVERGKKTLKLSNPELFDSVVSFLVKNRASFGSRLEVVIEKSLSMEKKTAGSDSAPVDNGPVLDDIMDDVILGVKRCHDPMDLEDFSTSVLNSMRKFDKVDFWFEYFRRTVNSNTILSRKLVEMYVLFLHTNEMNSEMPKIISKIMGELNEKEFPMCKKQFPEVMTYLKGEKIYSMDGYDYKGMAQNLLKKWKDEGDERIHNILSDEEIIDLS